MPEPAPMTAMTSVSRRKMSVIGSPESKCGVRSAKCGVRSAECGVRSAECGVRSAECGVRSAECGVRSAEYGVRCGVRSPECGVRSAESEVRVMRAGARGVPATQERDRRGGGAEERRVEDADPAAGVEDLQGQTHQHAGGDGCEGFGLRRSREEAADVPARTGTRRGVNRRCSSAPMTDGGSAMASATPSAPPTRRPCAPPRAVARRSRRVDEALVQILRQRRRQHEQDCVARADFGREHGRQAEPADERIAAAHLNMIGSTGVRP